MFRFTTSSVCNGHLLIPMLFLAAVSAGQAQTDPGVRGGPAGAGEAVAGLGAGEQSYFNTASAVFAEVESVSEGLGPRFNLDSCGGCHAHPAMGGSSPPNGNPQVTRASIMAPGNAIPSFLTHNGPVREVRFIRNSNGTPDGGVHAIFTISGRADRPAGCSIAQPDFSNGEAYNVEMGVTNENFVNEREEDPRCATNPTPESGTGMNVGSTTASDMVAFTMFMRFLDQPKPACGGQGEPSCTSANNGKNLFQLIGCAFCHTPTLQTGRSATAALSNKAANLYSDLAVHHMGSGLSDGVTQGSAGPDEFRTAPLWGLGKRAFFLHDGRTSDLLRAIQAHAGSGSEASLVVAAFNLLPVQQKQDILNFLRSL